MSEIIKKAFESINPFSKKYVNKNLDISEEVYALLESRGISQREFAKKLGKSPSEISKWLSGLHNLTLRSIVKMEVALGEDIIITSSKAKKKYEKINYVHVNREPVINPKNTDFQRGLKKVAFTNKSTSIQLVA